jgi:hypothetical protein
LFCECLAQRVRRKIRGSFDVVEPIEQLATDGICRASFEDHKEVGERRGIDAGNLLRQRMPLRLRQRQPV